MSNIVEFPIAQDLPLREYGEDRRSDRDEHKN
jgi:hypothetical protein